MRNWQERGCWFKHHTLEFEVHSNNQWATKDPIISLSIIDYNSAREGSNNGKALETHNKAVKNIAKSPVQLVLLHVIVYQIW